MGNPYNPTPNLAGLVFPTGFPERFLPPDFLNGSPGVSNRISCRWASWTFNEPQLCSEMMKKHIRKHTLNIVVVATTQKA